MSEEANDNETPKAVELAASPLATVKSPPGMILRTGKKKRRRSKETSGLTPEDEVKARRKSTRGAKKARMTDNDDEGMKDDNDDDEELEDSEEGDEDEDMSGDDEEEPEEDESKPAAVEKPVEDEEAVVEEAVVEEAVAPPAVAKKVVAIEQLRLPSQQTPGKKTSPTKKAVDTPYDKRYLGRLAPEDMDKEEEQVVMDQKSPIVDASAIDAIMIPPEPSNDDSPVKKLFRTITEMVAPQAAGLDLDEDDVSAQSTGVWRSPCFWFLVVLGLQIMFFQFAIHPVYTTMMHVSDKSVLFYKGVAGIKPDTIQNYTKVEVPVSVPPTKKKKIVKKEQPGDVDDDPNVIEHMEELVKTKELFEKKQTTLDELSTKTKEQLDKAKGALDERRQNLESLDEVLEEAEAELNILVEAPVGEIKNIIKEGNVMEALENLKNADPDRELDLDLLNLDVPMWEVVADEDGCPQTVPDGDDPLLSVTKMAGAMNDLKKQAADVIQEIKEDTELKHIVQEWIEDQVEDIEPATELVMETINDGEVELGGFSEQEAKQIVEEHLEIDRADKYGVLDVAAIYNGGDIIRRGPRATSPALSESLPLLNRLMAKTKLRFYGHGAKAAISPTITEDGLGQCWSFESITKSKNARWQRSYTNDRTNGRYATLSISLAKPIYVSRCVIDHVAAGAAGEPSSAIKSFRVFGYEDANAKSNPIPLGTFTYNRHGTPSQEFELHEASQHIQSVTLAVDTTHNDDLACLYRFRVLEGYSK